MIEIIFDEVMWCCLAVGVVAFLTFAACESFERKKQ